MAITLKADNRSLLTNTTHSYLNTNYSSGVTSLVVKNSSGFATNDYVLLGEFGLEQAEVVQVSNVNTSTHTLTVGATKFAHPESTKVTIIPYNQVRFYHNTTAVFDSDPGNAVTAFFDITPDSYYTLGRDTVNTTGYGFFIFYNSTTAKATTSSNAIPYAGFAENSVKKVLDRFFSSLNNKEVSLISNDEAFAWLNEGYSIAVNELNLINNEYFTAEAYDLTTSSGTTEYAVPTNFSRILSVYDLDNQRYIDHVAAEDVDWNDEYTSNTVYYYTRGAYIGFSPAPTSSTNYHVRYLTTKTALTSYYDNIDFPNHNYYFLNDYMMFRAGIKLNRPDKDDFYKLFFDAISRMKVNSIKQNANKDTWGIMSEANV